MPFPFGKSHKSPADIVKNLKESMAVLEKQDISDKKAEKATEEVSKNLVAMKEILYGTNEKEPQTEAVAQLAQELYNSGLLSTLVADLQLIDFEQNTISPPSITVKRKLHVLFTIRASYLKLLAPFGWESDP
uniref:Calcium binding protein 39 n=2 Tax=Bovidae TaxID=9895 RepID=A0AC11D6E8_SHEEP